MSGIAGILARRDRPVPPTAVPHMNGSLLHRGPDEGGAYEEPAGSVAIGIRRLAITNLAGGSQPVANEDGTVQLVMDGELYDHRALRAQLEVRGHRFVTSTDAEVAVHAYEEHGARFVEHLHGVFAIALVDRRDGTLLLARDRLGRKPLYYAVTRDFLVFASEVKAVLDSGLVDRAPETVAVDAYLAYGFVPGDRTLFAGVSKLPAAAVLRARGGRHEITTYWDVPAEPRRPLPTLDVAAGEARALLEASVQDRLTSEVPLGLFLSGGIDSTAVLALMTRLRRGPVDTFSIACVDAAADAPPHAAAAAQAFGAVHHEVRLEQCTPDLLEQVVWHHDEPPADPATVPTFVLARFARRTVTVALTGDGGDALFGGHDHYRRFRALMTAQGRLPLLAPLARVGGAMLRPLEDRLDHRTRKLLWIGGLPPEARYGAWHAILPAPDRAALRAPGLPPTDDAVVSAVLARAAGLPPLGRLFYLDARIWITEQLLTTVDRMTAAASLEARCPLLDQRLVELVVPLPAELKLSTGATKILLRRAARALVPPSILARPRMRGFEVPLRTWLLRDLNALARDVLLAERGPLARWVQPAQVRALWQRLEGRPDTLLARQLWLLLVLAVWHQRHWP